MGSQNPRLARGFLARAHRGTVAAAMPCLTLVTLECTPVDIAMSVNPRGAGVYSPSVLHPQRQLV